MTLQLPLPFPLNQSKPKPMKISKYIFFLPHAVDVVSKRFDVPCPSPSYLFVLYTIQYLPFNCSQQSILRHSKRVRFPISAASVSLAVNLFVSCGLVDYIDGKYSLAPRGREYLSAIRRYLLNQRL